MFMPHQVLVLSVTVDAMLVQLAEDWLADNLVVKWLAEHGFNSVASLSHLSGMTYIQGDTLTQSCGHESDEQQKLQEEEGGEEDDNHDNQADSAACDGQVVSSQVRFDRSGLM